MYLPLHSQDYFLHLLSWKVAAVTVEPLIASLKVAVTVVAVLTPVDPLVGETDDTVGGVTSDPDQQ